MISPWSIGLVMESRPANFVSKSSGGEASRFTLAVAIYSKVHTYSYIPGLQYKLRPERSEPLKNTGKSVLFEDQFFEEKCRLR